MSFSSLPEELVDLVCNFARYLDPDDGLDFAGDLLSLCLVSHRTLPSARRALYSRPFAISRRYGFFWDQAENLLSILESNDRALGRLVRETSGIRAWLLALNEAEEDHSWDWGDSRSASWYHRLLSACPSLEQVDFYFSTLEGMDNVLKALALHPPVGSSIRIRSITFACVPRDPVLSQTLEEFAPHEELTYADILDLLNQTLIRSLDTVKFEDVSTAYRGPSATSLRFPLSIRNLQVVTASSHRFRESARYFPLDPSGLKHLHLEGHASGDGDDLVILPSLVGPNLETLSLNFNRHDPHGRLFSSYLNPPNRPLIPLHIFQSFPLLTSLALTNTHGPSLRLLETLVSTSPLLSNIDFTGSLWISTSISRPTNPDIIFPEREIMALLQRFTHLEYIHLGTLPTVRPLRYGGLKSELSGIRVEFQYRWG